MIKKSLVLLFFLPTSYVLADSAHIRNVDYSSNSVLTINASPLTATMIQFGHDETLQNLSLGDSSSWQVAQLQNSANQLIIKPTTTSTDTDLIVNTNLHSYFFHLKAQSSALPVYAVIFHYPQTELEQLNAKLAHQKQQDETVLSSSIAPSGFNWDYSYSGDSTITPLHVFDDGTKTYFQFAPNTALPAVFGVDNPQGKEAVVNVRFKNNYLIVDRVEPQFTLRQGNKVTSIFNEKLINGRR